MYRLQVREVREYAMFLMDPDGYILTWNFGVERLLGYAEKEWIGQHTAIIFTPPERAQEICNTEMRKARENGSATDIRWQVRKDGSRLFANGYLNAVRDASGSLIGYTKVLSDETARKNLQDSLTESNAALEQFAYVASHDLQEPLRTIGTFVELLKRKYSGQLDAEGEDLLAFILSGTRRLSALVESLLAYARTATEMDRPMSVALDEDLEAAISLLSHAIAETGGTVTHDPMPTVRVDRGQMVRLFQNLIGNALKYHKPGVPPAVHISAEGRGPEWVIAIHDNGIGFDPRHASEIFAPLKRLHSNQAYPGTGVGLAICRRIVKAHGGRIWAESAPGEGTTFFFTLPVDGSISDDPRAHLADAGMPGPEGL